MMNVPPSIAPRPNNADGGGVHGVPEGQIERAGY